MRRTVYPLSVSERLRSACLLYTSGAYGSGEKSVQQNAKEMGAVAEKAVAEPEYVPAVRLYAGKMCIRDRDMCAESITVILIPAITL